MASIGDRRSTVEKRPSVHADTGTDKTASDVGAGQEAGLLSLSKPDQDFVAPTAVEAPLSEGTGVLSPANGEGTQADRMALPEERLAGALALISALSARRHPGVAMPLRKSPTPSAENVARLERLVAGSSTAVPDVTAKRPEAERSPASKQEPQAVPTVAAPQPKARSYAEEIHLRVPPARRQAVLNMAREF